MPLDLEPIKQRRDDCARLGWRLMLTGEETDALIERVEELEREWKHVKFDAQMARECLLNPGGAGTAAVFVEAIEERARRALSENNQEEEQHGE